MDGTTYDETYTDTVIVKAPQKPSTTALEAAIATAKARAAEVKVSDNGTTYGEDEALVDGDEYTTTVAMTAFEGAITTAEQFLAAVTTSTTEQAVADAVTALGTTATEAFEALVKTYVAPEKPSTTALSSAITTARTS